MNKSEITISHEWEDEPTPEVWYTQGALYYGTQNGAPIVLVCINDMYVQPIFRVLIHGGGFPEGLEVTLVDLEVHNDLVLHGPAMLLAADDLSLCNDLVQGAGVLAPGTLVTPLQRAISHAVNRRTHRRFDEPRVGYAYTDRHGTEWRRFNDEPDGTHVWVSRDGAQRPWKGIDR